MIPLSVTVAASELVHLRAFTRSPNGPEAAAEFYRSIVDSATELGLIELAHDCGSLTGLVLAAEGVGA